MCRNRDDRLADVALTQAQRASAHERVEVRAATEMVGKLRWPAARCEGSASGGGRVAYHLVERRLPPDVRRRADTAVKRPDA
jgi:hypothetical protein